jgi:hypothetical protein
MTRGRSTDGFGFGAITGFGCDGLREAGQHLIGR